MVNHEDPPLHSDSYSLVDIDNLPSDFESHFNDNLSVLNINPNRTGGGANLAPPCSLYYV